MAQISRIRSWLPRNFIPLVSAPSAKSAVILDVLHSAELPHFFEKSSVPHPEFRPLFRADCNE
jgi:hypothetical protein